MERAHIPMYSRQRAAGFISVYELAAIGTLAVVGVACGTRSAGTWGAAPAGIGNAGLAAEYVLFAVALSFYALRCAANLWPEITKTGARRGVLRVCPVVVGAAMTATFLTSDLTRRPAASLLDVIDTSSLGCVAFFVAFSTVLALTGLLALNRAATEARHAQLSDRILLIAQLVAGAVLLLAAPMVFAASTFCARDEGTSWLGTHADGLLNAVSAIVLGCWAVALVVMLSGRGLCAAGNGGLAIRPALTDSPAKHLRCENLPQMQRA